MDRSEIDLLDKDAFADGRAHEWLTWLRNNEPVFRHPVAGEDGFWAITKHADIEAASRNPELFSSDDRNGGVVGLTAQERAQFAAPNEDARSIPIMDPPEHTKYRSSIERGFRPRAISRMEDRVRDVVVEVLDAALAETSDGAAEVDAVEQIAGPITIGVLASIVGIPRADWPVVVNLSNIAVNAGDPEYTLDPMEALRARDAQRSYSLGLAHARRQEPAQDLITDLVQAQVDGEAMSDEAVVSYLELFLAAGHETTRNVLSHGFDQLSTHHDQYEALCADPELIPDAVEEILRWASPIQYFRRTALADTTLGGQAIAKGDSVALWYISANRDEDVYEDPFRFDIRREPNNHLAFGGGGPHFCIGNRLARLEITVWLQELTARVPSMTRLGSPDRLRSNLMHGIKHLPLRLDVGAPVS